MTSILFAIGGTLLMILAIWGNALAERLGLRRPFELYTSERLKRAAQIRERWGRVFQFLMGLALLLQAVNLSSLTSPVTAVAGWVVVILLVGCLVFLIATTLYYWRA